MINLIALTIFLTFKVTYEWDVIKKNFSLEIYKTIFFPTSCFTGTKDELDLL